MNAFSKRLFSKKGIIIMIIVLVLVTTAIVTPIVVVKTKNKNKVPGIVSGGRDFTVLPTEHRLVSNGKSEYKIVLDAEATEPEMFAADELRYFIKESTGAELTIIDDEGLTVDENSMYISIGDNAVTRAFGTAVDAEKLKTQGFRIVRYGKSVVILGAHYLGYGELNGVYEFLHHEVGYEAYSSDFIALDYKPTVYLMDFDISDAPDIEYRAASEGFLYNDLVASRRMRLLPHSELFIDDYGHWHNFMEILPQSTYRAEYPEWYSSSSLVSGSDPISDNFDPQSYTPTQLCLTAHGNEEKLNKMVQEVAERLLIPILSETNRYKTNITFTQEDGYDWCDCDACNAAMQKYNGRSALSVRFLNRVSDIIDKYFTDNNIEREINLFFFVYQQTYDVPATYDAESGEWIPIDETVVCRDNVIPFICTIAERRNDTFYEPTTVNVRNVAAGWDALSKNMAFWHYGANFNFYMIPYGYFSVLADNYKWTKEQNASLIFYQQQINNPNSTGFHRLSQYLHSKLAWDTSANVGELTQNFMKAYYGKGADAMTKLYDATSRHSLFNEYQMGVVDNLYDPLQESLFPYLMLCEWEDYIKEALAAVEPLAITDAEEYERLKKRIELEKVAVNYLLVSLYSRYYSQEDLYALKLETKNICSAHGISQFGERAEYSCANLWTSWGV